MSDSEATVDPSHVTFKGGHEEPGHLWYPYLEGFSPQFVRHLLNAYLPHAHSILDPFAGSNTTGFVSELAGRRWVAIDQEKKYVEQSRIRFRDPVLGTKRRKTATKKSRRVS